jgi:hypothetical protein
MNTILIVVANGSHAPYDENQARAMLKQGLLRPETLYWKEGMAEWRPLSELPPAQGATAGVAGAALPLPTSATGYTFTKNPETLAMVVEVMLVISLLVAGLQMLLGLASLILTSVEDFKTGQLIGITMKYSAFFAVFVYICTAIPFAKWIYRANLNCRGFGANLTYSPGGAIGCYFIPFANLVFPYEAMQEIWKASCNPADWKSERGSYLIGCWWAFWLLHSFLGGIVFYYSRTKVSGLVEIEFKLKTLASLFIVTELSKIILCILAFALIYLITDRQKKLTTPASRPASTPLF